MYSLYIIGIIIIFALILLSFNSRIAEDNIMKGFWNADASFCKKAELDMFVLYLGDNVSYGGNSRHGYLLASNEHGIILNNPIRMSFSGAVNILPGLASCKKYDVSIDWKDTPPADSRAFPTNCKACYYPRYGKLVFYEDDQIIVSLWKDNQMSSLVSTESLHPDSVIMDEDDISDNDDVGEAI